MMTGFLTSTKERRQRPILAVRISDILCQPDNQQDPKTLQALANRITQTGILQPFPVRKNADQRYELVSGSEQFQAAKLAGLQIVPCILSDNHSRNAEILALVEQIQQQNLSFFEEASAIERLISHYGMTQEDAAAKLGKAQSTIANKLRLLRLPGWVQEIVEEGQLSERHARALLRLEREEDLRRVLDQVRRRNLTVEQTEALVDDCLSAPKEPATRIVLLRDYRLFVNTLNRAVQIMAQAGIRVEQESREEGEYVEYRIRVPKVQAYRQPVPARHAGDPLAAKR